MAKKFITERERLFIDNINDELIEAVVGQEVNYYAISREHTQVHRLYNEAIKKTWAQPVKINARIMYDNSTVTSTNLGLDSKYSLDIYFHVRELTERNVKPREGDFVEFNQIVYEITTVTQPQMVFGQPYNKLMTKCTCVPSREGQFQIGGKSDENIDNSHPVEQSKAVNK